ncbi:MAG: AAA family ATPase [Candidatus Sungiibacteriota bacterium]|uniref:AAA family ATPase n=1 Tax=Candidatus Sungiibacteriota bacterium TaxID=2750080 RepID=A0A7T5UQ91_9BACT|nr:MAG: AAA family ATPase [Candidatus Sungbacteria bacterium]
MPKKNVAQIKKELLRGLKVSRRRTKKPEILALVGITGAGNSTIAREFSRMLGWTVIEKNKIRVKLREEGPGFTVANTNALHEAMVKEVIMRLGNVILDSDMVEKPKRKRLERLARKYGARVAYLHLTCNRDVMLERMIRAKYNPKTNIFKSAAIAVREHCRRYPWHYRWSPANGGQYVLRKLPIKFFAEIDTTDPAKWRKKLRNIVKRLKKL